MIHLDKKIAYRNGDLIIMCVFVDPAGSIHSVKLLKTAERSEAYVNFAPASVRGAINRYGDCMDLINDWIIGDDACRDYQILERDWTSAVRMAFEEQKQYRLLF